MENKYKLGSIVVMKKPHACQTNEWIVTRVGVDVKIKFKYHMIQKKI